MPGVPVVPVVPVVGCEPPELIELVKLCLCLCHRLPVLVDPAAPGDKCRCTGTTTVSAQGAVDCECCECCASWWALCAMLGIVGCGTWESWLEIEDGVDSPGSK